MSHLNTLKCCEDHPVIKTKKNKHYITCEHCGLIVGDCNELDAAVKNWNIIQLAVAMCEVYQDPQIIQ